MADQNEINQFIAAKGDLLENVEALEIRLGACEETGLIAAEDELFEEINDLIEAAKKVDTEEELRELCTRGQAIEMSIDAFLAQQGYSTLSLEWPYL